MDVPNVGLHPEGEAGLWVFRMSIPNVGQIIRGEVKVPTTLGGEAVSADRQKALALEKVHLLAEWLLKASETL